MKVIYSLLSAMLTAGMVLVLSSANDPTVPVHLSQMLWGFGLMFLGGLPLVLTQIGGEGRHER